MPAQASEFEVLEEHEPWYRGYLLIMPSSPKYQTDLCAALHEAQDCGNAGLLTRSDWLSVAGGNQVMTSGLIVAPFVAYTLESVDVIYDHVLTLCQETDSGVVVDRLNVQAYYGNPHQFDQSAGRVEKHHSHDGNGFG